MLIPISGSLHHLSMLLYMLRKSMLNFMIVQISCQQALQVYAQLLVEVACGRDLRESVIDASKSVGVDITKVLQYNYSDEEVVHRVFGSACYITDSFPR